MHGPDGTVAVVTGGGTGIGAAIAEALARAGAAAVAVGYTRSVDDAARHRRPAAGARRRRVGGLALDVADDEAVRAAGRATCAALRPGRRAGQQRRYDRGRSLRGPRRVPPTTSGTSVLDVNLVGAFRCARALGAAPARGRRRGGRTSPRSRPTGRGGSRSSTASARRRWLQLTRGLARGAGARGARERGPPGTVATRWQTGLHGEEGFAELAAAERARAPLRADLGPEHVAQAVVGAPRTWTSSPGRTWSSTPELAGH